jgi:ABC-2 type transport system ATP-binding protein
VTDVIEIHKLTKIYSSSFGKKNIHALIDLSLNVRAGTIFGLLGPNGAGKTTLVKILLGITFPTSGWTKIFNTAISDYTIKKRIGYLPENHKYPPYLTGEEVMIFFGKLSGIKKPELRQKIKELLELVKLEKWKRTKVKAYSKGMMQRLGLAQALLNEPELIFLDEPTDGVDPIGRKEIRDILLALKSKGKTIFLNSHLLSEVELITDRVGILNKGRLIREGTVKELTERKEEYLITFDPDSTLMSIEDLINGFNLTKISELVYSLKVADITELNRLIDMIRKKEVMIKEIIQQKNTLEDIFISLIKEAEGEVK